MKRLLSVLLSIIMMLTITVGLDFTAYALNSSGTCGANVTYTFNSYTGELVISGTGPMDDFYYYKEYFEDDFEDSSNDVIVDGAIPLDLDSEEEKFAYSSEFVGSKALEPPYIEHYNSPFFRKSEINTIVIETGVTSIGKYAFTKCVNLKTVIIPDTVIKIGESAFSGCTNLEKTYYLGSESSWRSVSVSSYALPSNNTVVFHATHNFSMIESVSSSCTSDGYEKYSCECGIEYVDVIIGGHDFNEEIFQPTHVDDGYITYTCTRCDYSYISYPAELKAIGHISDGVVIENAVEPTCTLNGSYDEVLYCTVCGEEYSRKTISAETKNTEILVEESKYPESPHSYNSNMNKTYSFSYLGADSLRITFSSSTETESGCDYIYLYDSNGSQIGKYDGKSLAGKTITINGDSFSIKLTSNSSVETYGFAFSSIYAIVADQSLLATGHISDGVVIENAVEPTCTLNGSYDAVLYCTVCGEEYSRNTISPKILVEKSKYPESSHSYNSNMNKTYSFSYLGADSLRITFSSLTETESGYDYIYLYDSNGSQIGKYDGKSLAGKSFTINGDSFSIKLTSDGSVEKYGFAFSSIYAVADQSLLATGHVNGECIVENFTASTCTENGAYDEVVYCTVCGEEVSRDKTVIKAAHKYEIVDSIEADCENDGLIILECSVCGDTIFEEPRALGHDIVIDSESVAATCTEDGLTRGTHCTRCDKVTSESRVIPALGHNYYITDRKNATCTEDGYKVYTCNRCGDSYTINYDALGHNSRFYRSTVTCEKNGYDIYICSVCSYTQTIKADALGHDIVVDEAVPATCIYDGLTEGQHCIRCDKIMVAQDIIPATGHSYIKTDSKSPSCTKDGFDIFDCRVCSATNIIKVDALGHSYDVSIDDGVIGYSCQRCDDNVQKTFDEIVNMWDMNYFNKAESECPFLDIVDDGIINAKDYAMLRNLQKNN